MCAAPLLLVGCGGDHPDAATGLGDASGDPGGGVAVVGAGGAGGGAGSGGAGGNLGACDNESDLSVLVADNPAPSATTFCGDTACVTTIGNEVTYATCVSACIETRTPGISVECAACYGELAACGLSAFCFSACQVDACSILCTDCLDIAGCFTSFADCRGLDGPACP